MHDCTIRQDETVEQLQPVPIDSPGFPISQPVPSPAYPTEPFDGFLSNFDRLQPVSVCHRLQPVVASRRIPLILFNLAAAGFSRLVLEERVMSGHVYHEIYLHFNWHTKDDLPLLTGELEQLAHAELRDKCHKFKGAYLHEIGGTDTHVHLAINIEPFVTISELVQELKGASFFQVNKRVSRKALEWQRGYGVVSFGKGNLDWVREYIRRQREHHAKGRVETRLELHDTYDEETQKSG